MTKDYTKHERQQLLKSAIEEGIGDQHHLLDALREKGIETTQATISRDLQELGFVKVRVAQGIYRYQRLEKPSQDQIQDRLRIMFHEFVTDISSTQNLIVVKTLPGNANGVARVMDESGYKEILGTIAGDDNILVVVDTEENRRRVEDDFLGLLGGRA